VIELEGRFDLPWVWSVGGRIEDGYVHIPYRALFPLGSTLDAGRFDRQAGRRWRGSRRMALLDNGIVERFLEVLDRVEPTG